MKRLMGIAMMVGSVILGGCASMPLAPEAMRVVVSPNPAPKGCKYLGQVVGNQGNFFTGGITSNRNLEEGAMNDLKNRTSKMGGNYIELVTTRAGNTGSWNRDGGSMQQTNVTNLGNAYSCPEGLIGLR